ncbi:hypothetical protein ES708_34124 [subsurface metagenome]
MSKRIFTKVWTGYIPAQLAVPEQQNALEQWLVQEDIEVIGAEITLINRAPSENDGFASCTLELSQVGVYGQDGSILAAGAQEGWNTVPQGISLANGNVAVTFPLGLAVPVKEEGYLYLNAQTYGKTAGVSTFRYLVIAHYTKRGA